MQENKQQSDGGSYVTVIKKFMSTIIIGMKENGMAGKDIYIYQMFAKIKLLKGQL